MNMGMRSSVRLIAKIDARGGVAGGRWDVTGGGDAKKKRTPETSCPPTASALPRTKDFGTVLLAARGSDYSGGGGCERGECAMLHRSRRYFGLERTSPAYRCCQA